MTKTKAPQKYQCVQASYGTFGDFNSYRRLERVNANTTCELFFYMLFGETLLDALPYTFPSIKFIGKLRH